MSKSASRARLADIIHARSFGRGEITLASGRKSDFYFNLKPTMAPSFGGAEHIQPLWWCLSLGACLGGNGTLIGASANLTVAGIGDRNGVPFKFLTYTLYAFPLMLLSVAISHVYVWWRYF